MRASRLAEAAQAFACLVQLARDTPTRASSMLFQGRTRAGLGRKRWREQPLIRVQALSSAIARPSAECEHPQHDEVQNRNEGKQAPCSGVASFRDDAPNGDNVGAEDKKDDKPVPDAKRAHDSPKVDVSRSGYS